VASGNGTAHSTASWYEPSLGCQAMLLPRLALHGDQGHEKVGFSDKESSHKLEKYSYTCSVLIVNFKSEWPPIFAVVAGHKRLPLVTNVSPG